jgi:hypothetical protein
MGISINMLPLTDELVNENKALYFGISSDLISSDYYPCALLAINVILVEVVLALRSKIPKRFVAYHFLAMRR